MSDQVLRQKLIRLAQQKPELRKHLSPLLKTAGEDNSYGAGHFPLPDKLRSFKKFVYFRGPLVHKVFPAYAQVPEVHMLTVSSSGVSVMLDDLKILFRMGLIRIQSNDPGYLSFYFEI